MKKLVLLALLFFSGCFSKHEEIVATPVAVSEVAQDIRIPKAIMAEVEKEITEETKLLNPVYVFIPLQVELTEKNANVLKEKSLRFIYPKGGGELDLKQNVTGMGSFYLHFPPEQFAKLPELMHLYYVSQAPAKKIDQEIFGLGCGKWVDLKKQFKSLQKKDFLKLNTTDFRYIYVLTGHYIFVFRENNQIYLAQLTVTDSRYTKDLCFTSSGVQE